MYLVSLCRLINEVQVKVSHTEVTSPEPSDDKWSDFVEDLWECRLPNFRRRGYMYSSAPSSPLLGGAESEQSSKILEELIRYSSETNLLDIIDEDEEMPVFDPSPPTSPPLSTPGERSPSLCDELHVHHVFFPLVTLETPAESRRLNEEIKKLAHDVKGSAHTFTHVYLAFIFTHYFHISRERP